QAVLQGTERQGFAPGHVHEMAVDGLPQIRIELGALFVAVATPEDFVVAVHYRHFFSSYGNKVVFDTRDPRRGDSGDGAVFEFESGNESIGRAAFGQEGAACHGRDAGHFAVHEPTHIIVVVRSVRVDGAVILFLKIPGGRVVILVAV